MRIHAAQGPLQILHAENGALLGLIDDFARPHAPGRRTLGIDSGHQQSAGPTIQPELGNDFFIEGDDAQTERLDVPGVEIVVAEFIHAGARFVGVGAGLELTSVADLDHDRHFLLLAIDNDRNLAIDFDQAHQVDRSAAPTSIFSRGSTLWPKDSPSATSRWE